MKQLKGSRNVNNDILVQDSADRLEENQATVTYHSIDQGPITYRSRDMNMDDSLDQFSILAKHKEAQSPQPRF